MFAQTQEISLNPHGKMIAGLDCSDCHFSTSWKPVKDTLRFNHNRQTTFQLIGRHQIATCSNCHVTLDFSIPKAQNNECTVCHTDVHQGKLGTYCEQCHNQHAFNDLEGVKIHMRTSFPLTGAHVQVQCINCHQDQKMGAFTTLETDCYSCHQKDYESTKNRALDHVSLGYPTDCKQCHNTMGWANSNFDHLATTGYPLIGAHAVIRCQDCHEIPSMKLHYKPLNENDCYSCHFSDYQDEHGGSNTPTTCLVCHNQNSWDGADFNHSRVSNGFELVGAHAKIDCSSCHIIPGYQVKFTATVETDCISCHATDYDRKHTGTGFSTNCTNCHTVEKWTGATFKEHDTWYFPIYSGKHRNVWGTDCKTCHTNPSNYKEFYCTNCHEHNKEKMDKKHKKVTGYVYLSSACYSCHPKGEEHDD